MSYLESWLDSIEAKSLAEAVSKEKGLFVYLMRTTMLCTKPSEDSFNSIIEESWRNNCADDPALFEIACFLFYVVDEWFWNNRSALRNSIFGKLLPELIRLFSIALSINEEELRRFYDQRTKIYFDLTDQIEKKFFCLVQLVTHSVSNKRPSDYELGQPQILTNALNYFYLEQQTKLWYIHIIPGVLTTIEGNYSENK
jgi:hypothetical protein